MNRVGTDKAKEKTLILPKKVVQELPSYDAPAEGRRQFVRLDFNENTVGFPETLPHGIPSDWINTYPEYTEVKKKLAQLYGVSPHNLLLTNGSDEAISLIASTFIEPGTDKAIVSNPCFLVIPHSLKLAGATVGTIDTLPDMEFNIAALEEALESGAKIAMFASPDNPSGCLLPPEKVLAWCDKYTSILFVIDEAYAEYSRKSLASRVPEFDNLLVTRTFSKAWGLAGLRLGVVIGTEQNIEFLQRVRLPFSVNAAAIWTLNRLLDRSEEVMIRADNTLREKQTLISDLEKRGCLIKKGEGNFFLLSMGINASRFTSYCQDNGILIRNRSLGQKPGDNILWGMVRVSVGTSEENAKFLRAFDSFHKT